MRKTPLQFIAELRELRELRNGEWFYLRELCQAIGLHSTGMKHVASSAPGLCSYLQDDENNVLPFTW
jgi:hypothetical protein